MRPYLIEAIDGSGCSSHWVNLDDVMAITTISTNDWEVKFGVTLAFVNQPLVFACDEESPELGSYRAGHEALLKAWKERDKRAPIQQHAHESGSLGR